MAASKDLIKEYLKLLGSTEEKFWSHELPIVNIRAVLLLAIKDMFDNEITYNQLEYIALDLYYGTEANSKDWNPHKIYEMDHELDEILAVLSDTPDLNLPIDENSELMKSIKEYFENKKFIIKAILDN